MKSLHALKINATRASKWRGHNLKKWLNVSRRSAFTTCQNCNDYVTVNTMPLPNDIEIGGTAVALTCDKSKGD